jgi:hypothetical protein
MCDTRLQRPMAGKAHAHEYLSKDIVGTGVFRETLVKCDVDLDIR